MSDRTSTITAVLVDSVSGTAKKIQGEITGLGQTVSKVGSILSGIGVGIGIQVFDLLEKGISSLAEVIPNLIESGNAYLEQLHAIQLETGMTAEQTSLLVGQFKALGVPTDTITTLFAQLSQHLETNEGLFARYGIATRNARNEQLPFAQIIENTRTALSAMGQSAEATSVATQLFGRGARQVLEFFQASPAEIAAATDAVKRWGGVLSQDALSGAERFKQTLASLQQGITDIGANIAAAVDPYLRAFVDSFASFVQSHLNEIVQFAVTVVNVITGFLSGLFGITSSLQVTSDAAASSAGKQTTAVNSVAAALKQTQSDSEAYTKSIQAQIKAIDEHTHAIQVAAEKRHAIRERERLQQSLSAAQAQLADLRGSAPFLGGGLSAAEQALAVQKHAQDIIDAEKDVKDKRQALGDFEADQKDRAETELLGRQKQRLQDLLTAQKANDAARLASVQQGLIGQDTTTKTVLGNIGVTVQNFGKQAAASFQVGVDAARSFIDILLGAQTAATGPHDPARRTGGVVGALAAIGGAFADITVQFIRISGIIGGIARNLSGFLTTPMANSGKPGQQGASPWDVGTTIIKAMINQALYGNPKGPRQNAKGGWVGMSGPEIVSVGEQGPEYIVPNGGTAPGGGTTVHMHFDFLSMPSDAQIRSLTDQVSRRLAFELNHSPVTSKPYGAY